MPPVDPLLLAVARAVVMLLRRELTNDEETRRYYGQTTGTPPREIVQALGGLESALRLHGEVVE